MANISSFFSELGVDQKSAMDVIHFTNYTVYPKIYCLYIGSDHHIHSIPRFDTSLSQSFKHVFFAERFSNPNEEVKEIYKIAKKAFNEIITIVSQDKQAVDMATGYLSELLHAILSVPDSASKSMLLQLIQEARLKWALQGKNATNLSFRELSCKNTKSNYVLKDSFAMLTKAHTSQEAMPIAVLPFLNFPQNIKKMIEANLSEETLDQAAREVADFYQTVQQIDDLAPNASQETKRFVQNCLSVYGLEAEKKIQQYPEGESALQAAFSEKSLPRPSIEFSKPSAARSEPIHH